MWSITGKCQTRRRRSTTKVIQPEGKDKDEEGNQGSNMGETSEKLLSLNDGEDEDSDEVPGTRTMMTSKTKALADTGHMNSQSSVFGVPAGCSEDDGGDSEKDRSHEYEKLHMDKGRAPYMSQGRAPSISKDVTKALHSPDFG